MSKSEVSVKELEGIIVSWAAAYGIDVTTYELAALLKELLLAMRKED